MWRVGRQGRERGTRTMARPLSPSSSLLSLPVMAGLAKDEIKQGKTTARKGGCGVFIVFSQLKLWRAGDWLALGQDTDEVVDG